MSYSYSSLKTYLDCPRKYYFIKKEGLKPLPGALLLTGQALHEIIHKYISHLNQGKVATDFSFLDILAEEVSLKYPPSIQKDILTYAKRFGESFLFERDYFVGTEKRIALDKNHKTVDFFDSNVYFRGILDFIERKDNLIITDFKFSYKTADRFQLQTYAWLSSVLFPEEEEFILRVFNLRTLSFEKDTKIKAKELPKVFKRIESIIEEIEKDKTFKPRPSNYCSFCSFLPLCGQIRPWKKALPDLTTPEKAQRFATQLYYAEELVKQAKSTLKEYCQENGAVPLLDSDLQFDFAPRFTNKIENVEEFANLMWKRGEDPFVYLNVDMRRAKKLLSDDAIKGLVKKKKSLRFEIRQEKGEKNEIKKVET